MSSPTDLSPADILIFGGLGDLSLRKIVPSIYFRLQAGQLPPESRIYVLDQAAHNRKSFEAALTDAIREAVPESFQKKHDIDAMLSRTEYFQFSAADAATYTPLANALQDTPRPVRVAYLAMPASLYGPVCQQLGALSLITPDTRVVLEKPIGHDLSSFNTTNEAVLTCVPERQVYRIDHYLGKETVQNLMVLRFSNAMFEKLWDAGSIDHVQITVAETVGIAARHNYYDRYGALRDMVQNHLLQLLCLLAMEPPAKLEADAVRDEKLKVLRALRPIHAVDIPGHCVRGQYRSGSINGEKVGSYVDDIGHDSTTESFVALKLHVDNWRWSGVPFYLRTGKRLQQRYSEIVIQFKPTPHNLFAQIPSPGRLIIRLQPDETIRFGINTKVPGPGGYRFTPVTLNLSLDETFAGRHPDAYERLLMDIVRGNPILFMRTDEVQAAWAWTDTVIEAWQSTRLAPLPYVAGGWGPEEAAALLAADGRSWMHDEL